MSALVVAPPCPILPATPPHSSRNLINPSLVPHIRLRSLPLSTSPAAFSSFQPGRSSRRRLRGSFLVRSDGGDPGFDVYEVDMDEVEETDNKRDFDLEYERLKGSDDIEMGMQSNSFVSTQMWEPEVVVDYRINEDEFHKISLLHCDFFIRKPPDPDEDVYDFREMYVTPPDMDVYSIPKVLAPLPQKYIRCAKSNYGRYILSEPPVDALRDPLYKSEEEVLKVFLTKHYRNRRKYDPEFVLDFEEIYVIDSKTKSISRAKVVVTIPEGRNRNRRNDMLIIRDGGNSFKIIDESEKDDPTDVIEVEEWLKSRQDMEKHLRKLRDFHVSNWF